MEKKPNCSQPDVFQKIVRLAQIEQGSSNGQAFWFYHLPETPIFVRGIPRKKIAIPPLTFKTLHYFFQ